MLGHLDAVKPSLLILDSVQTVASPEIDGAPGGMAQVREVAGRADPGLQGARHVHAARRPCHQGRRDRRARGCWSTSSTWCCPSRATGTPGCGWSAASRTATARPTRSAASSCTTRASPASPTPRGLFLTRRDEPVPGTCLTVTLEGRRPLVAEVQALTVDSQIPSPRRTTSGLETSRVSMMLAVLEQRGRISALGKRDIYTRDGRRREALRAGRGPRDRPRAGLRRERHPAAEEPGRDRRGGPRGRGQTGHGRPAPARRGAPSGLHPRPGSDRPGQGSCRYEGHGSGRHGGRAAGPPALAVGERPHGTQEDRR